MSVYCLIRTPHRAAAARLLRCPAAEVRFETTSQGYVRVFAAGRANDLRGIGFNAAEAVLHLSEQRASETKP